MRHLIILLFLILIILTGIFLPYLPGDYDYFSVGLSYILQFASFTSLPLVLIGGISLFNVALNRKNNRPLQFPKYLLKITISIFVIIILAAALGAFASNSRFTAILILCAGSLVCYFNRSKITGMINNPFLPYYFIVVPMTVIFIRISLLEKVKNQSTDFVVQQCEALIQDIEAYKNTNGHYPHSLLSTIEDYKPGISGIPRFHYEPRGEAYNIYFEQVSTMLGTEEIVMYNKLDQQQMTVHNQDLLRVPYPNILHGYHKVEDLPQPHWKIFYFD